VEQFVVVGVEPFDLVVVGPRDLPGLAQILRRVHPARMAVAETWHPTSERTYLYATPDELGQVFDFSLLKSEWGRNQFRAVIQRSIADHTAAGAGGGLTWVLSSHDVCRHSSRFALPPGSPGQLAAEQRNGPTG